MAAMKNLFSTVRSFIFAALSITLHVWYLPQWMGIRGHWDAALQEPWRWLGALPAICGTALMMACVWRFGTTGEGTPMPLDPPRKFVVVGPYRFVRNPMYLGMAMTLIGEALLFAERASLMTIVWYGLALIVLTHSFVVFYEEPTLKRKFGREYEEYCRRVNRWLPVFPK